MPKRIPVGAATYVAREYGCRQVIIVAWDGEKTHVVTYGVNVEECAQAAEGGNRVKRALGWPESLCNSEPSSVKQLKARVDKLEALVESVSLGAASTECKLVDIIDDLKGRIANAQL